jgi:FdhD protein
LKSSRKLAILRLQDGGAAKAFRDDVAAEEPLELRVQGNSLAVLMRTPGQDQDLCAGFLLSEGIIRSAKDIGVIERCENPKTGFEENVLNVLLAKGVRFDEKKSARHFFASSSCGICGKASLDAIRQLFEPLKSKFKVKRSLLWPLPEQLRAAQLAFAKTGGLHASGIFDEAGELLVLREDVGRHNALDKVIGHCLMNGLLPLSRHILLVSGRVSFELMQKALSAGIPLVAAIGAPSTLAVEFAKQNGQTLVGFLKDKKMNIYAHPRGVQ